MIQHLSIDIPAHEWLTSNQRLHWTEKAARTKAIRQRTHQKTRQQQLKPVQQATITCTTIYRTGRGLDADACAPTLKAIIDGLIDAGILPDDNAKHLTQITYQASQPNPTLTKGWHTLNIQITNTRSRPND